MSIRVTQIMFLFFLSVGLYPIGLQAATTYLSPGENIQVAVDAASDGDTIVLSNGVFYIDSEIRVLKGVTVRSFNGAEFTVIDGTKSSTCFHIGHSNAVLDELTIRNGEAQPGGLHGVTGGGVYMTAGTVQRCTIVSNTAGFGGGVYCDFGGSVVGCIITSNCVTEAGYGGGVFCNQGGVIERSMISYNTVLKNGAAGGVYCNYGGTLRNCIVAGNMSTNNGEVGGVKLDVRGNLENCTIVNNSTRWGGGGVYGRDDEWHIKNCIVWSNSASYGRNWYFSAGNHMSYSCTTPDPTGSGNITAHPQFVDISNADYHLQEASPCIDRGAPMAAVPNDFDLVPRPLDGNGEGTTAFDMGVYEFVNGDADSDGDWFQDSNEIIAGTDPTDGQDFFCIASCAYGAADEFIITWDTVRDRLYTMRHCETMLSPFTNVKGFVQIAGSGMPMSYTNRNPTCGQSFYSVIVQTSNWKTANSPAR